MIDPRIAWFAIGATSSAVLFGWPWHPRFSRYSRRSGNDARRPGPYTSHARGLELPPAHPTGGRVVDMYGRTIGYQPRSQDGTPNPPPEAP